MHSKVENKYVAFCDILGFSNSIEIEFKQTLKLYQDFKNELSKRNELFEIQVSVYSDSIIIIGDNLLKIAEAVQILLWRALNYKWIVRGGIAYGKHWKEADKNNLFIVSEGLVKAVNIEKRISHPVIAIDDDIKLGLDYWLNGFTKTVFELPIICHDNLVIINPFSKYWFKSGEIILKELKLKYITHEDKYSYLLNLINAINLGETFIPKSIIEELLEKKMIHERKE